MPSKLQISERKGEQSILNYLNLDPAQKLRILELWIQLRDELSGMGYIRAARTLEQQARAKLGIDVRLSHNTSDNGGRGSIAPGSGIYSSMISAKMLNSITYWEHAQEMGVG